MGGSVTKIIKKAVNVPIRTIRGLSGGDTPRRSAETRSEIASKTDAPKKTEADRKTVSRNLTKRRRSTRMAGKSLIGGSANIAASGSNYSPIRNPRDTNSKLG